MKKLSTVLAVLCVAAFSPAADLRSMIVKMNRQVDNAIKRKDSRSFERLTRAYVTDDFKYMEDGKTMSYDEMLAMMKGSMGQIQRCDSVNTRILSLKQRGNMATASSLHTMSGRVMGPDKKSHRMKMSSKSMETYVKDGKMWKMKSMSWSNTKMTMDGKPMDPKMMGGGQ